MGLAHVPFEGGQKAKHQNKQNSVVCRAVLRLVIILKVPNKLLKGIYTKILGIYIC